MNPDGYIGGFSLHLSSQLSIVKEEFVINRITAGENEKEIDLPELAMSLVFPLRKNFTIRGYISYDSFEYTFNPTNNFVPQHSSGYNLRIGGSLSFYFKN